ncbi:MAG: NAD-dependent epimerase/dehydratase family protein [Melioribacteraceae bacterium]|nr:NAD-dependent epimerase/dehydratase family protein [Melioribacteraceae bacterium]
MESKTISVVTGGSGFVGSHMVDLLIEKGHIVKCIVRESSNLRWLENKPVEIIKCGLFDTHALEDVLKDADYLFHIAGVVKAKRNEDYLRGNVETTKNLLGTVVKVNPGIKRVLIVSSQTASGPSKSDLANNEETEPRPITRYGKSKLAQERLAQSFMDKIPITIIRAPAVYGERDTEIYLVLKTYKNGLMTMVGFDEKKVSIIYVKDLANGMYLAATKENAESQTYFISSKEYYTWHRISKAISAAMGKKAVTLRFPHFLVYTVAFFAELFSLFSSKAATFNIEKARDFVQRYWTCDITKAEKELGYTPEFSLEDGMKRTVEWYRSEKWL